MQNHIEASNLTSDSGHVGAASDEIEMFQLAPVSLWLEDYSGLKQLFTQWRNEGVTDLRAWLLDDMRRVSACSNQIRVIKVNRETLVLYEADDLAHLVANLSRIFRDDMLATFVDELGRLWDGEMQILSDTVNYSLTGKRLDIRLRASVLPGHLDSWARVMVAIENVTERETTRRKLAVSEAYARGLFEHSPVSLWVEDFSSVKRLLDDVRERGITDFRVFTDAHPEFVERCMRQIRVVDVNQHTLDLFCARDKAALLHRLSDILRDDVQSHFKEQLIEMWQGKLLQQREVVNYSLDGERLDVFLQFSVLPGYDHDWSLVLVALTDITARKKAEASLEYLGMHDVLTTLYNRAFYVDELDRMERKGPFPISILMGDLNNLKGVNDLLGHAAGDALLRRIGEVLLEAIQAPLHAARIGGDEFCILMPATDERGGRLIMERIRKLIEINNQSHSGVTLSLSMGLATSEPGEQMENVIQRADIRMYEDKRNYYKTVKGDRRSDDG